MIKRNKLFIPLAVLAVFAVGYVLRGQLFSSYIHQAEVRYGRGEQQSALADFLFASALDERDSSEEMRVRRAEIFLDNYQLDAAEQELAPAAAAGSRNSKVYILLGHVASARGDYEKADQLLAKAATLKPSAENIILRAKQLVRAHLGARASAVLNGYQANSRSEDISYYVALLRFDQDGDISGLTALKTGKYSKEVKLVQAFQSEATSDVGRSPDYLLVKKAELFNSLREPDFAWADVQQALRNSPDYADAWLTLGKTLLIEDDYAGAASAFEKCVALDSNNRETFLYLQEVYAKLGDANKAAEYGARYRALTE
jgi:uncharacterized protein HemY